MQTVNVPDSSVGIQTITVNGLVTSKRSSSNLTYTFTYDGLGRRTGVIDPRIGQATVAYYTSGTGKKGKIYTQTDAAGNTTTYDYTSSGRLAWVKNALNKYTYYDYNTRGQVTRTWGDTGYPIEKGYDSYGQMTMLKTYRAGTGWTGSAWPTATTGTADVTTWSYDASSGLVTAKTFADSNSVSYTYTNDGKLSTRTWARTSGGNPLTTTYSYDANTGERTGIDYSDSTQNITFSYTRTGQQYQVTDSVGTRTFAYNAALQQTTETIVGGLYSKTITRDYATTGMVNRYAGLHIGIEYDVDYGYDTYGRFSTITNGGDVYTYGYLANSDLIASLTYPNNIKVDYAYEANRDLITQVKNTYNTNTIISQYDYTYDAIYRRNDVDWSGTAFSGSDTITYGYNDRSELTSADATTNANYNFAFAFDNIGNRSSYSTYETGSQVSSSYTANNLNQYTAVNDGTAYSLSYDNDGNITSLSTGGNPLLTGTWNAENRLISIESPDTKLEFKYDYMGRRVEKKVYSGSTGSWTLNTHLKFVYNEYEQIEELDGANSNAILKKRIWGLSKLIADVHGSTAYYAVGDANKNITEYLDRSGAIQAHYEYSPFGKITKKTGIMQNDFDFRFSSEYHDTETGLVYYNYRYYSPSLGRWLSRDPIEEEGGYNLYGMVNNNPICYIDCNGQWFHIAIGAVIGAVVGGVTAAVTGGDVVAGAVGGAVGGAVTAATGNAALGGAAGNAVATVTSQIRSGKDPLTKGNITQTATNAVIGAAAGSLTQGVTGIANGSLPAYSSSNVVSNTTSNLLVDVTTGVGSGLSTAVVDATADVVDNAHDVDPSNLTSCPSCGN